MHKQPKNDKVLKAITIGIAAMMATSAMPATVFANENPDTPEPAPAAAPENSGSEVTNNAGSEETTVTQEVSEIQESVEQAVVDASGAGGAIELIDAALVDANVIGDQVIIDDLNQARNALDGIDGQDGAADQLAAASNLMEKAAEFEAAANQDITTADQKADNWITQNTAYQAADTKTTGYADDTIDNAKTANSSDDEQVAYAAKEAAIENLELMEAGFVEANNAYAEAFKLATSAEEEYAAAEQEHQQALAKVAEAKAKLMEAQMNSIAASEMLKAAQDRANSLEQRAEKLEETRQQLEAIRTQYYAMMVQYYRDVLKDKAVYNTDGTLNIEECAAKMTEQSINKNAAGPTERVMKLGRDLMKKLVEYQIMTDENVDWSQSEFTFGKIDAGTSDKEIKEARQGIVFESDQIHVAGAEHGEDQVVVDQTSRKDINGGTIYSNPAFKFRQIKSTDPTDSGRTNRVLVTYKDKDGNEHSAYYNYVFKSSAFGDDTDLAKGMVSLVEVVQVKDENDNVVLDKNGKPVWETKKILNENNFDDYQDLLAAIEMADVSQEYESAKVAVDEAAAKVEALTNEIKELQKVGADGSKLVALKTKLDNANKEFLDATEKKVTLGEKVEEARAAVANIDLSRFDRVVLSDDITVEDEGAGGGAGGADLGAGGTGGLGAGGAGLGAGALGTGSALGAGGATGGAAGGSGSYTMPSVNSPVSGGAAVEGGGITLTDAELPGAGAVEGTEATGGDEISIAGLMANAPKKSGQEQNLVTLADEQLAGAMSATAGEVTKSDEAMNWLWLLIIALFGAAGRKMYEKYKERKEQGSDNLQA